MCLHKQKIYIYFLSILSKENHCILQISKKAAPQYFGIFYAKTLANSTSARVFETKTPLKKQNRANL